jgi:hypothetical protein
MPSIGHDELTVLLEHDHGREAVAPEHRFGILRHGAIVDVGTRLRSGVEPDCIKSEVGDLHYAVSGQFCFHHLPRRQF